jgi:hypothetical protein
MVEWILILTMHIMSEDNNLRDVQLETISGFTSKETCEHAGNDLALQLVREVGKHREQQNIKGNSSTSTPSIFSNCIKIVK